MLIARVQPGALLVRTSFFRWTRLLMRLDLPTFERPANATSAKVGAGNCPSAVAPATNSASSTSMVGL